MDITKKVEEVKDKKHKLLLVVGGPGSGKSKVIRDYSNDTGIPITNLDKIFANTPNNQLVQEMKNFLSTYHQDVLLLDNKRVIYAKDSEIDLLSFLKEISENIVVVSTWNGKIEDGQLYHIRSQAPSDLIYSVDNEDFEYILC
ncbi:MAG: BREX-3 system P-loop-containing protein BrxF [Erysipelotrichaceae bacterium]|nr:BREX-3 system P-loop-containing protein BrxF [Erysipelotrichaceae bacterium]